MKRFLGFCALLAVLVFGAMWMAEDSGFTLLFALIVTGKAHWWVLVMWWLMLIGIGALGALVLRPWWLGFVITIGAVYLAIVLGQREQVLALNQCIGNRTVVQQSIEDFHRRAGRYPATLAEIGPVPCRRFPRGTVIDYRRTASGYHVRFGDWLVTFEGSEREPITARK